MESSRAAQLEGRVFSFAGFRGGPPMRTEAETAVGLRILGQLSRKVDGARCVRSAITAFGTNGQRF